MLTKALRGPEMELSQIHAGPVSRTRISTRQTRRYYYGQNKDCFGVKRVSTTKSCLLCFSSLGKLHLFQYFRKASETYLKMQHCNSTNSGCLDARYL